MLCACVVVEGKWEGSAGCLVHADVDGECGWLQCIVATEHSKYSLSCMQKL